jgi:two-component SAPR family response regulator
VPEILVLAVDDQPLFLKLIEAALGESGYAVLCFEDPRDALEELRQDLRPHVIISDVSMPYMDGFEFYQHVRDIADFRAVPFLFLTALGDRQYLRRGMTLGADDYVTKPFTKQDLVDAVSVRLRRIEEIRQPLTGTLRVSAFGTPEVNKDGERLEFDARKALELFLYLLEHPDGVSTFEVAEALWPGKTEPKASSSFHTTLYRLRKSLGGDFVETKNRRYYLQTDVSLDYNVRRYRDAADAAKQQDDPALLRQAAALYGGDYLAKLEADWIDERRSDLQALQRSVLQQGLLLCEKQADLAQATLFAEALTSFEPFEQQHWHKLEQLWQARGEMGKARAVIEQFETLLEEDS